MVCGGEWNAVEGRWEEAASGTHWRGQGAPSGPVTCPGRGEGERIRRQRPRKVNFEHK